ncbi:MAG: hypothetical protein LBV28_02390, partial [Puniceicoccales bacterium]|nr:hypothetical protein [Puniceicoccales bacterium]
MPASLSLQTNINVARPALPTIAYIRKRDGRTEIFYIEKITHAIQAAVFSSGLHDNALADAASKRVAEKLKT